jgi:Transposase DDE domain
MLRHERATGIGRAVVGGRALAAAGAAEAQGRAAAGAGPGRAGWDHLRAQDRPALGVPAAGAGLRQRGDLLAAPARLAAERALALRAAHAPAAAGRRRGDRLVAGQPGLGQHPGQKGGPKTGPNPTDRGKPGTKRHLVVDRIGIPLAAKLSPANYHDARLFEALIEAIPALHRPPGRGGPAAGRASCTRTRATPTRAAAATCGDGASAAGSPAGGSTPASAWAGTAGSSSGAWHGWPGTAGWRSATSAGTTSTRRS